MSTSFSEYINSLIDTTGFVPDANSFEHQRLVELFKGDGTDVGALLTLIERQLNAEGAWSVIRFAENRVAEHAISVEHYQRMAERVSSWILQNGLPEGTLSSLVDIYFATEKDEAKKRSLIVSLLNDEDRYQPTLHLAYLTFNDLEHLGALFPKIFLKALNTPKGNHLGMMWHGDFVSMIARSAELNWFLSQIVLPENEHALSEFADMGEIGASAFFGNLPIDESIANKVADVLRRTLSGDDSTPLFLSHRLHQIEEFRNKALQYLNRCGISIFDFLLPYAESNKWVLFEFIAQYIRPNEVLRLPTVYGLESGYFFWVYDHIVKGDRGEKDELIARFRDIEGFSEKLRSVQEHRDEQERLKLDEEAKRILNIRSEIQSCIEGTSSDHVHPHLIELFDAHQELFTPEQKSEVELQVRRFFSWDLFSTESAVITRYVNENGGKGHTGGFWYMQGFFLLVLRVAKEKLGLDIAGLISRKSLVRAIAFNYLDNAAEKLLFDSIGALNDSEVDDILTVYDGSRQDDLAGLWGGQNFFPFIERFKEDFSRPANVAHFRAALTWWVLHDSEYHGWEGKKALEYLTADGIIDKESDIPMLKSVFHAGRDEMEKNPEGTIGDSWDVHSSANAALIRLGDEESISWRLRLLLVNKIAISDPTEDQDGILFRSISEIESEILHGGSYIRALRGIDTVRFESEILGVIDRALSLLDEDRLAYGGYARYLLSGMFGVLEGRENDIAGLLSQIEAVYAAHGEPARFAGGFALRDFQGAKIRSLEPEQKDAVALSLLQELRILRSSLPKFQPPVSKSKSILLLEGVSDCEHVRNAWNVLKHSFPADMTFEIENGRCANKVRDDLQMWDVKKDEILIGLFDFDEAGFQDGFLRLKAVNLGRADVFGKCACISSVPTGRRCEGRDNVHALMLPVTSEKLLDGQVFNSDKQEGPNSEPKTLFYNGKPYFVIEHLFYGIDDGFDSTFFEPVSSLAHSGGWKLDLSSAEIGNNLSSDKHGFAENLPKRAKEEFGIEPVDLYKNFIPIFKKIQSIIYPEESQAF